MEEEDFTRILNSVFNDEWEIKDSYLYIHFPKITISNKYDKHHDIYDLFVRMNITCINSEIIITNNSIKGMRTSFSYEEYDSDYTHSHLYGFLYFDEFCLGDGPINMSLMEVVRNDGLSEEELIFFFYQLIEYLKWESIEGIPYRWISNICLRNRVSEMMRDADKRNISKKIKPDLNVNEDSINVIRNKKLDTEIIRAVKELSLDRYLVKIVNNEELSLNGGNGDVNHTILSEIDSMNEENVFLFKDVEYPIKIINESTSEEVNGLISLPMNDIDYIIRLIEIKLIKEYENKYGVTKKSGIANFTKYFI